VANTMGMSIVRGVRATRMSVGSIIGEPILDRGRERISAQRLEENLALHQTKKTMHTYYLEQGSRMEEACFEEPQRVLAGSQLKQMHTITTLCTGVLCSD
jgi:hypothetical protein